jgi:prepilin-type processing-associated H-X9-DG protein
MSDESLKNSIEINTIHYHLEDLEQFIWKKLVTGSVKKKNGFRTMCVGTVNQKLESSLRIVVNRKADELKKEIIFHTDNRSRKFDDLQRDPRLSLLFYDGRQKIQILIKAHAKIHTNDSLKNERWKATSMQARLGYMTIDPPNTPSRLATLGYHEQFTINKPTETESDLYKENFSVIVCQAYELEFLYLGYHGNRKANFFYTDGILENSFWAVP